MDRFHLVVFNYERINLFLDNFSKIQNFRAGSDKIRIFDCSANWRKEKLLIQEFCSQRGLTYNVDVLFNRRENWGIDQGARLDFAATLHSSGISSQFVWQFQEHYLDIESPDSRWPAGTINVDGVDYSGEIKGDCVPDSLLIDLDECQNVLENKNTSVIYADRLGIAFFPYLTPGFYCIDGGNFCCRTTLFAKILDKTTIRLLRSLYDQTYEWSLFVEHFIGLRATRVGKNFYDLDAKLAFSTIEQLVLAKAHSSKKLFRVSEEYYGSLVLSYLNRCGNHLEGTPLSSSTHRELTE